MRLETNLHRFSLPADYLPLKGPLFESAQRSLAQFNAKRLDPGLGERDPSFTQAAEREMQALEAAFVASARREIAPLLDGIPSEADAFLQWFEALKETGPGQNDVLFPFLAGEASLEQMRWFLAQEVAGEAGFDDLVALCQIKMPARAKLEMARNYWDEMGQGNEKGMHGPMLARLAGYFGIAPTPQTTVAESLALGNMMIALCANRRFAFHGIGALGAIELTAPGRAALVAQGLERLGVPKKQSHYFVLHAVLDVKHAAAWNTEVIHSLVEEDSRRARALAEGALLRLWCGARCFERYRREFGFASI